MPETIYFGDANRFFGAVEDTVPGVSNTLQTIDFSSLPAWPADGKGVRRIVCFASATLRFRLAPWLITEAAPGALANTTAAIGSTDKYPMVILGAGICVEFVLPDNWVNGYKGLTYKCSGTSGVLQVSVFR